MKINLLSIAVDLLALLAYPVFYLDGILHQASGSSQFVSRLLVPAVVHSSRVDYPLEYSRRVKERTR